MASEARMKSDRGGTTHVRLHAITGLASSHSAPFVRLLHEDVIAQHHRPKSRGAAQAVVAVELPEDQTLPTLLKRAQQRRSEYTAQWARDDAASVAFLPIEVDWIELQVWNCFTDVAVFLGTTSVSLRALRREGALQESNADRETGSQGRLLWFPLDVSKDVALLPRRMSSLSVQVSISFHPYDARTQRIQREISERRRGHTDPPRSSEETKPQNPVIVDPSFQFTRPSSRIEWSSIVAANVKRIFLQGDTDELLTFYEDVVHGDMDQEIDEDEDIVVDEDHLKAFRLAQLSTQYIEHCVELLGTRRDEYEDHHRALRSTRRDRKREHKELQDQKRRLQEELDELELLTTTYGKLLEQHGQQITPPADSSPPLAQVPSLARRGFDIQDVVGGPPSPVRESSDVVSKKPTFLMTWEEREQARKQQKELDKARRIEDEKVRLQGLFKERHEREKFEMGITSLARRRQERSARKLQRVVRAFLDKMRFQRLSRAERAAKLIQTNTRRFLCRRRWPRVREVLRWHREQRLMELSDRESATQRQDELLLQQQRLQAARDADLLSNGNESESDEDGEVGDPVRALDLVATWKKIKRIFTLACQKGARSSSVFAKLDSRADGVVDRAEFRLGVRYFGIRIDRKMTRAVIALVRAKCDEPPKPLTITLTQFTRGFDLPEARQDVAVERVDKTRHETEPSSPVEGKANDRIIRKATRASAPEEEEDEEDRSTSVMIEEVANAVANLRRRVLEAASDHLAARNKSTNDYFAFRQALTHVFEEFDVDGNGELDVEELVSCMASINFRVTLENVAVLRECFVSDPSASDSVSISEFISFALAGMKSSSPSSATRPVDEELGILGYKLRDSILGRVKLARKQTASIEDAVRLVFKNSYRSKHQQSCSRSDFVRMLASLRLGFTPAQLSRLVLRLDQDGDNTVSFDELLAWLRLRVGDTTAIPSAPTASSINRRATFQGTALDMASSLRSILRELAGLDRGVWTRKQSVERAVALFQSVDDNNSNKINASELEGYLYTVELSELHAVSECRQEDEALVTSPSRLAEQIIKLIDLNGNGVVTLEEWTGFLLDDAQAKDAVSERGRGERYAIVEGIRHAMRAAFSDESALLAWFRSIPGAILVDKTRNGSEMKVRSREFKNAVRTKFPFISAKDVDEAMKLLDADGSGWITEKEIRDWQFPTRDIEELRAVIARAWALERESTRLKGLPEEAVVDALYQRFDHDGNGLIARNEVRAGFLSFRVTLNDDETKSVIQEFDLDKDGFWNKTELAACVRQLAPRASEMDLPANGDQSASESDQGGYDSPDAGNDDDAQQNEEDDEEGYSDDDKKYAPSSSDSYSLSELSPLAMSPPRFSNARQPAIGGVEYSEDFDEDA